METTDADHRGLAVDFASGAVPSLPAIRRQVTSALADLGEDHLTAVLMVLTELVTNAHDHGSGARQVRLSRERDPCRIHIEVDDRSPGRPTPTDGRPTGLRGRGLRIVDKLCHDWGGRPLGDGGKTVWATVDCATYGWQAC